MSIHNPFCDQLHAEKYRGTGESHRDAMSRVAGALKDSDEHFHAFRDALMDLRFMPAGRIQAAMGAPRRVTPYNCFVMPTIEDSFVDGGNSIMEVAKAAAGTMRMGGGVGYDWSTLRPNGDLIAKLGSRSSGPVSFMEINDAVCRATASAGDRRGAQMGVLRVDHPDIERFIAAKQPPPEARVVIDKLDSLDPSTQEWRDWNDALQRMLPLAGFNISVAVTDEFMRAVEQGTDFALRWGGRTYSYVDARNLWEKIMRSTWDWAEPGVLFIDRINTMNNLWYCETIAATNPCLAAGTLVSTAAGFRPVEDVQESDVIQTVMGLRVVKTTEAHKNLEVFKVALSDGTEIRATAAHIFHVQRGKHFDTDTRLDHLEIGDRIRLAPSAMPDLPFRSGEMDSYSDRDYGFLVGAVIGDGCYTSKSKTLKIACGKHESAWVQHLSARIPGSVVRQSTDSCATVESTELMRQLDATPLARGYSSQKALPLELLNSNERFLAGYIDGYISTDGNVHMSKSNPMVRVSSTSHESLMMLKRALSCFGILARIYTESAKKPGAVRQIEGRDVTNRNQGYVLVVLGSGLKKLHDRVGLSHPYKASRLRELVLKFSLTGCTWSATVKSIEPDGKADVYDLFEPETDTWITDGVVNRGCGEQPLPPWGACLLGSFNLVRYVRYVGPSDHEPEHPGFIFDFDSLRADIPVVVRAMDNVVDRATYPLYEQEKEARAKRRMGLGITGAANAIERLGHPYGSEGFCMVLRNILMTIRNEAYMASAKLAAEKGAFPAYNEDAYLEGQFVQDLPERVKQEIEAHGIRNSHLTSIAPTGTISLCADNVSSGIEPVFAYEFDRTVRTDAGEKVVTVRDYGVEQLGVRGKQAKDVTLAEHLEVLTSAQRYVDSAVSKTCNVPPGTPWDDFKALYMNAWRLGAKGCTTFTTGGRRFGVLNASEDGPQPPTSCEIDPATGRRSCE